MREKKVEKTAKGGTQKRGKEERLIKGKEKLEKR